MADREKVIKGLECCNMPNNHDDCPYNGAAHYNICTHQLLTDAIALLKEQEPRVLTLEEAATATGSGYLENWVVYEGEEGTKEMKLLCLAAWCCGKAVDSVGEVIKLTDERFYNREYGIRVWTGEPTDEQREAVKWDG